VPQQQSADRLSRPAAPSRAHDRFCSARQAATRALDAWLRERPDPDDVLEEIEGGARMQRQLLRLALSGDLR
jgi:hypothetical protein